METLTLGQTKPLLASDEVTKFNNEGFIGPFDGSIPTSTIDRIADRLEQMVAATAPHPLYGRFSVRDWHLVDDEVLGLFADPRLFVASSRFWVRTLSCGVQRYSANDRLKVRSAGIRNGEPSMARRSAMTYPGCNRLRKVATYPGT